MSKMCIYEPALCCETGLCGVNVDPELLRISTVLNTLKNEGVEIERFNLNSAPMEFVKNNIVNQYLNDKGIEGLPVVTLDGEIVIEGRYPANDEILTLLKLPAEMLLPKGATSCCCGDDDDTCCSGDDGDTCCSGDDDDTCCSGDDDDTCCCGDDDTCCSGDDGDTCCCGDDDDTCCCGDDDDTCCCGDDDDTCCCGDDDDTCCCGDDDDTCCCGDGKEKEVSKNDKKEGGCSCGCC